LANSFLTHLECGSGCGAGPFDPREKHFLCPSCGLPMLARYDLNAARSWKKESLTGRAPNMWRYREMMPLLPGDEPVTLGEGFTPLLHAGRIGASLGLDRVLVKDESLNPTNSFKARGLSAAVSRAKSLNAETIFLPTAGNAGNAAAAYAAAAGMRCEVFIPKDAKQPFVDECRLYGANVTLVDGLITDAGRIASETAKPRGWYEVATFREVGRGEGKKTMGYELAEQLNWTLPDWIIYPTGGGTGLVGMWKAFAELQALGWLESETLPRMVSVQSDGCAPIVRAFESGARFAEPFANAHTVASGLRVPAAVGDFLILDAIRDSGGTAIAVASATDAPIIAMIAGDSQA
jgi:threonine synthase